MTSVGRGATVTVAQLLGPGGVAERIVPGWEARPAQLRLAEAIFARLTGGGQVVVEAPTGVGKTLGYLVPAVLSGKRVVISTNTKTLQDQIVHRDLPALAAMMRTVGWDLDRSDPDDPSEPEPNLVRYALMKGRSNYLCLDRLRKKRRQRSFDFETDTLSEIEAWAKETVRGDRAELVGLSESSPLWGELDARSEICSGTRCEAFESCFVTRMRKEASRASLVIVNHHLLMADIALKAQASLSPSGRSFGAVIPECDALIVDEAHALEEIASEHFGGQVSTRKLERLGRDLYAYVEGGMRRDESLLRVQISRALETTEAVFGRLPRQEGRVRLTPSRAQAVLDEAKDALPDAEAAIAGLVDSFEREALEDSAAESLARRSRELLESLRFVLGAEDPDFVYWAERSPRHAGLGASPIDVSNLLGRFMYDGFEAVALTSATLSAGEADAGYFRRAVGVGEDAEVLILDSPFDFASQAALYLPHDAPDPSAPDATERLASIGESLIRAVDGGAMYLFTSYRVMHAVHARLKDRLPYPVLMQGEAPKRALLEAMVTEAPAVLFATASFWEGVDIPGDPLRLVLIDKLPFDSPGDPLVSARSEALEAAGKSAFNALLVPRAILRLEQGFGRLVRSTKDRGVVAILDRRIQKKGYGKRFVRALPEATVIRRLEGLEAWWRGEPLPPTPRSDIAHLGAAGGSAERETPV